MKQALLPILLALFTLSGCQPTQPLQEDAHEADNASHLVTTPWSVSMTISGGIAGWQRAIELDHTGVTVVHDLRLQRRVATTTANKTLAAIDDLITELQPGSGPVSQAKAKTSCADCVLTRLIVQKDGESFKITSSDLSKLDPTAKSLIEQLMGLLNSSLSTK